MLLETINTPADLRRLDKAQLPQLARELRDFVIGSVSQTGGHLSSNLGTVELTIALHYVYNTPHDRLVWDVGHQAYPHKVLTGRREQLYSIKQYGGLAPFPLSPAAAKAWRSSDNGAASPAFRVVTKASTTRSAPRTRRRRSRRRWEWPSPRSAKARIEKQSP